MPAFERLEEYVTSTDALAVDREAGVIRGVKLLGLVSKNGRRYHEAALKKALSLYEGKPVNIDHTLKPTDPRSAYHRFGRVANPELRADGIYGAIEYLKSHPLAAPIAEAAERMPKLFGMSHVADGKIVRTNQENVVAEIRDVISVDVVADPATTHGLNESEKPMPMKIKDAYAAVFKEPRHAEVLKLMEQDGMMPDAPMELPGSSPDEQAVSAFKAMVLAVLDDTGLDVQGKLAKIREILKAQEKLMMKAEEPAASEGGNEESSEAVKALAAQNAGLQEQVAKLTAREDARQLIEKHGLKADEQILEALASMPKERRPALCESLKRLTPAGQIRSATALKVRIEEGQKPTNGAELAKILKRRAA